MSSYDMPEPMSRRIGYALKRAQHALSAAMNAELRPLGLTPPQYAVLSALELNPGISNASLARAAFVTAQTMHGIVANLEQAGHLRRKDDPTHGRILKGELTKNGATVLREAHRRVADVEGKMLASLNTDEVQRLADRLLDFAEALGTVKKDGG